MIIARSIIDGLDAALDAAISPQTYHEPVADTAAIRQAIDAPLAPDEKWLVVWCHMRDVNGYDHLIVGPDCPIVNTTAVAVTKYVIDHDNRLFSRTGHSTVDEAMGDMVRMSLKDFEKGR